VRLEGVNRQLVLAVDDRDEVSVVSLHTASTKAPCAAPKAQAEAGKRSQPDSNEPLNLTHDTLDEASLHPFLRRQPLMWKFRKRPSAGRTPLPPSPGFCDDAGLGRAPATVVLAFHGIVLTKDDGTERPDWLVLGRH
jgi:hypothetical protein